MATSVKSTAIYNEKFFSSIATSARASAEVIVPLMLELLQPKSVVDVGCGTGEWLAVFRQHGVDDVLGIDGMYADTSRLQIPRKQFVPRDLTRPLDLERTFDLAISVEVAEHLPATFADEFVATLTDLAPVVLFSAAIPQQGGVHHVNEQWQDYWVAKFRERGYAAVDAIRSAVWNDRRVEWWYAQNTLVFVRKDTLDTYPKLREAHRRTDVSRLSMVHPHFYSLVRLNTVSRWSLRQIVACVPSMLANGIAQRFGRVHRA